MRCQRATQSYDYNDFIILYVVGIEMMTVVIKLFLFLLLLFYCFAHISKSYLNVTQRWQKKLGDDDHES